jgi:hypothetical protein
LSIKAGEVHIGGPPLLFATDIRMTILVTLALADGPIRQKNLWKHIGKSSKTALYPLVKYGIVAMWGNSRSCQCVALDPCHPAADALRSLLLAIAKNFDGFRSRRMRLTTATPATFRAAQDGYAMFEIPSVTGSGRWRCSAYISAEKSPELMSDASCRDSTTIQPGMCFGCTEHSGF